VITISSLQFKRILELTEYDINRCCWRCGCPKYHSIVKGEHKYYWDVHFAKCEEIKSLRDDNTNRNFRVVKGRMQFKDIVIDEVYECRWDCSTVPA